MWWFARLNISAGPVASSSNTSLNTIMPTSRVPWCGTTRLIALLGGEAAALDDLFPLPILPLHRSSQRSGFAVANLQAGSLQLHANLIGENDLAKRRLVKRD